MTWTCKSRGLVVSCIFHLAVHLYDPLYMFKNFPEWFKVVTTWRSSQCTLVAACDVLQATLCDPVVSFESIHL